MMKAVGYKESLPINDLDSLIDIDLAQPIATGRDFLMSVILLSLYFKIIN